MCLVYTKGTGDVNIRSHVSSASPRSITLLSISTRLFSSIGNAFIACDRSINACSGRLGARNNRRADVASSLVSSASCSGRSSSGPLSLLARHRGNAHAAHRTLCRALAFSFASTSCKQNTPSY